MTDTVTEAIEPLLRFHETGGHEGDGSDERLAMVRAALDMNSLSPSVDKLRCQTCKATVAQHEGVMCCHCIEAPWVALTPEPIGTGDARASGAALAKAVFGVTLVPKPTTNPEKSHEG